MVGCSGLEKLSAAVFCYDTGMSSHKSFWNKEYKDAKHLTLSDRPAEDLVKFTRWLERNTGREVLNPTANALDCGCGNGRNLLYLSREFGCRGFGIDSSDEAIKRARAAAGNLPITFSVRLITEPFPLKDASVSFVLDMMTSHVLPEGERGKFRREISRVLKPGGFLLFKTHLKDGDIHSARLLKKFGTDEHNSYIHPRLGVYEHVWSEAEIREFFEPQFEIRKILRSHKHIIRGRAGKRRTMTVYLQKR